MVTPVPVTAYALTLAVDGKERPARSVLAMTTPDLRDESPLHTRRLYKYLTGLNGERIRGQLVSERSAHPVNPGRPEGTVIAAFGTQNTGYLPIKPPCQTSINTLIQ
ncbi:hypothetical protein [Streptomyces sp. NPDC005017]|uniref:hypothetical protein n=1 Tax=Streptomyces sp. NPDC005017 TaxID=3364706 RepID=UPI0036C80641